jgi:CheY-like chemotaxis protein
MEIFMHLADAPRESTVHLSENSLRPAREPHRFPYSEVWPRRRILIADDVADAAESLAILLRFEGHEVEWVCDGAAALDRYKKRRHEVLILDLSMPLLSGYEVAHRIRREMNDRAALLIAVSGWARAEDRARGFAAGFDHHFVKPLEHGALSRALYR